MKVEVMPKYSNQTLFLWHFLGKSFVLFKQKLFILTLFIKIYFKMNWIFNELNSFHWHWSEDKIFLIKSLINFLLNSCEDKTVYKILSKHFCRKIIIKSRSVREDIKTWILYKTFIYFVMDLSTGLNREWHNCKAYCNGKAYR